MFKLTREVRIGVNAAGDMPAEMVPSNAHAGFPSLQGVGQFLTLRVMLGGELNGQSGYLRNIKEIDDVVRRQAVPELVRHARRGFQGEPVAYGSLLVDLFTRLRDQWPGAALVSIELSLSPFLSLGVLSREYPMAVRLNHKFEFSASHRLFNRDLADDENCRLFGKCSNPHGHGHNYEVQVTLAGEPGPITGLLDELPAFERIVNQTVIERFDHKNLNVELAEFAEVIPSVENISRVIYQLLRPKFVEAGARLASVTVWETPRTWAEYSE